MNEYFINHFEDWYLNDLLGNKRFLGKTTNSRKTTYSNPIIESLYIQYIQENREQLSYAIDLYLNYEIYFSFIEKLNTTTMVEKDYFIKNKVYKDDFVEFDMVECAFKNPILQALFLGFKMSLDDYDEQSDEITDDEIDDLLDDVEQSQLSDENVEKNKEAKELIERLKKSVGEYQVKDGLSEYIDEFNVVIDDGRTIYQYHPSNFEKHLMDYCITSYFNEELTHENRYREFKDLVRDFYYSIPKDELDKLSPLTKINLKKVVEHMTDDVKKKNGGILYS